MVKSILHTLYCPPQVSKNIFVHEKCLEKMHVGQTKRLVLLKAGPGYGKTNLLAVMYQKIDKPRLWLALPDSTFTYDRFLIHLFFGLLQLFDEKTRANWERVTEDMLIGRYNLDGMVTNLINLALELADHTYIFIDDLHFLRLDGVKDLQSVHMLLRFLPDKVHLLAGTRNETPFPVNRLRLEEQIVELEEEDLLLNHDDMKKFVSQTGIEIEQPALNWLMQVTDGWIAGICLMLYWAKESKHAFTEHAHIPPLHDYLNEIFAQIPTKIREFLLKTCIFETISPEICDQYLDITDSQQILDELVEQRLLTYRHEGEGVLSYKYHNILRDFFLSQLDSATRNVYNLRLAEVYRQRGMIEAEITHMIAAGKDQEAIELIKKEAPRIMASSDVNLLHAWLDALEENGAFEDPLLNLYRGNIAEIQGHLEKAQIYYLKAEPGLKAMGDMKNWITVRIQIAGIYWWKEAFHETLKVCEETLPYVNEESKQSLVGLYNLMGSSSIAVKERARGIDYLLKAREFAHQNDDSNGEAWILNNLAFGGYFPQGRLMEAIETYIEALKIFRQIKNKQGTALVFTNLGYIHLIMNELKQAQELFDEAEKIYLEMNNVRSVRSVWILQCNLQLAQRNWVRTKEVLQKIEESLAKPSQTSNFQQGQFAMTCAMYYREQDVFDKAEEWMAQAGKYLESCADVTYFLLEFRLQAVNLLLKRELYAEAIKVATEVVEEATKEGFELLKTEARLLLAVGHKYEHGNVPNDILKPLSGPLGGQYAFLKQRYAHLEVGIGEILPLNQHNIGINVIEQPVRIHFLREFLVYNQGKKLSAKDWSNRKALDLLKYLLLQHNNWVRQEDILESFWPESDVERGKQTLYVALYTIRRTWDPDLQKSKESKLIQTKRGMYHIQLPPPYWIDIEAFNDFFTEGMRFHRERRFSKAQEFLLEAKKLYTGDFLPENLYDEWTLTYREDCLQNYLQVLTTLAGIDGDNGDYAGALDLLYQALAKNQFQDSVHELIIRYLLKLGRVNEAIQHFREFDELYEDELGVGMPDEIKALYHQLVG